MNKYFIGHNWETQIFQNNTLFWFTGLLCAVIGFAVMLLDFLIPEKMKEVFSVGVDEDNSDTYSISEGYINTSFLDGGSLEGVTVKTTNQEPQQISTLTVSIYILIIQALQLI